MTLTRRDFFKLSAFTSAGLYLLDSKPLFANLVNENKAHHLIRSEEKSIVSHNLISNELKKFPISIKGHDFYQHPLNQNILYVISKWEDKSIILDLASGRELSVIKSYDNGFNFYGHIAFNADGSKFYSPQINVAKNIGLVVIYDTQTNKPVDTIGNIVGGTHDVCFLSDKKTLVVTSDGVKNQYERVAPSSLFLIDTETKKQVHQFHIENNLQKVSHLRLIENDEIIVLTTPLDIPREGGKEKHGYVYSNRGNLNDEILYQWKIDKHIEQKLDFEILSSAYNPTKHELFVTNPHGKLSLVFNTKNRSMISSKINEDQGVVMFNNNFISVKSSGHAKIISLS